MSEHHGHHRRELRQKEAPRYFEKAEILFIVALVTFTGYYLFVNSVISAEGSHWKWSAFRMLLAVVGIAIAISALISLVFSALHFNSIINGRTHAPVYPPLLLILLNVGVIVATILFMLEKMRIEV